MKRKYSDEFKAEVLDYIKAGHRNIDAAKKFGISTVNICDFRKSLGRENEAIRGYKTARKRIKKPKTEDTDNKPKMTTIPVADPPKNQKTFMFCGAPGDLLEIYQKLNED
jgi:transposase-like protein